MKFGEGERNPQEKTSHLTFMLILYTQCNVGRTHGPKEGGQECASRLSDLSTRKGTAEENAGTTTFR